MKHISVSLLAILILQVAVAQKTYTPVDAGSRVHFVIKNFGISAAGDFTGLTGTITFDPAGYAKALFDVSIDASTIDTDNGARDTHLKKEEYFDVEKFRTLHFKSTKVTRSSKAGRFFLFGDLTIKGVTKPVSFPFSATAKDGGYIFEGSFEINRRDFGVGGSSVSMADKLKVELKVIAK